MIKSDALNLQMQSKETLLHEKIKIQEELSTI